MKRIHTTRLNMYLAVKAELQVIVSSVGSAGLSALNDVFTAKVAEVYDLHQAQGKTSPPQTAARNDVLEEMTAAALAVAGPLGAHAYHHALHDAGAVADISRPQFERLRLVDRTTLAQRIHDAALPLVVALTPLGVPETALADLQAKIDAAKAALHEPRTTIVSRRKATEDLARAFSDLDRLLEHRIDRVLAPLAVTHPDLHHRYFMARQMPRRSRSRDTQRDDAPATMSPESSPAIQAAA